MTAAELDEHAPSRIGRIQYRGALLCADVFLWLAGLTLGAGVLFGVAAVAVGIVSGDSGALGVSGAVAVFAVAASVVSAASTAFFGYVLRVLVGIFEQVWEARSDDH
jgi:hypothetical protein